MGNATERSSKLQTEKYTFDILIRKLLLTLAKAVLLKVIEAVACLQWNKEKVRGEELAMASEDNSQFYCKGKKNELV